MPIETICQGCQKRLRVADEHAGKLAKCPHCQAIYTVPQSAVAASWGAGSATDSNLAPSDRWHLKTPDGLTFGPVARAELDRWLAEGRVTTASQILHEGDGRWVWAQQIYPHLAIASASQSATAPFPPGTFGKPIDVPPSPFAGGINPYASPSAAGYAPSRYREQSRGGTILTLSILGPLFCIFLSIAAVVMGIMDLSEMKRGVRDPSGRGLTIAGLVIGSIYLGLIVLIFGIGIIGAILDS
jgi:hypothetical protein